MNYPLISEYVDSIMCAEDNFATLTNLRPVLDEYGHPIMSSGNFSVVFKMEDIETKELFAIKCFIKDQAHREDAYRKITNELAHIQSYYLIRLEYLESELFVSTRNCSIQEFPVVKMDWVDGVTMNNYLASVKDNNYARKVLFFNYCKLCTWLLKQPFAHGDIKPDNIIVDKSGYLVLVDYDGMYVPSMDGEQSRELGSEDYRHPQRTYEKFDKEIDDFSILTIAVSLLLQAECYEKVRGLLNDDQMVLGSPDYFDKEKLAKLGELVIISNNKYLSSLFSMFLLSIGGELLHGQLVKSIKDYCPLEIIPFSMGRKEVFYDVKNGKILDDIKFDWITPVDSSFQQSSAYIATQCFENGYEPGTLRTAYKYKKVIVTCIEDLKSPIWYESIWEDKVLKEKKNFIVHSNKKAGVIDSYNNIIVDVKYDYIKCSKHGNKIFYSCTLPNIKWYELLDEQGKPIFHEYFSRVDDYTTSEGKLHFMLRDRSSKWRMYDVEGNQLSEEYDDISRQYRMTDWFIFTKDNDKALVNIVTGRKIAAPCDTENILDIDGDIILVQKSKKHIGLWNFKTQAYITSQDFKLYELSYNLECKIQEEFVLCTNLNDELVMLHTSGKEFIIPIHGYHNAFQTGKHVVVLYKLPVVKRGLCPYKVYLFSINKLEHYFEINQYSGCNPYGKFSNVPQDHVEIFQQTYFTGLGEHYDLNGNKITFNISRPRTPSNKSYREVLKENELHQLEIDISKKYFNTTYLKKYRESQNKYCDNYDGGDYIFVNPGRILSSIEYFYDFGDDEGHTDSGRVGFVDLEMCYWNYDNN